MFGSRWRINSGPMKLITGGFVVKKSCTKKKYYILLIYTKKITRVDLKEGKNCHRENSESKCIFFKN